MTPTARPNSILNRHLFTYALAGGSLLALCPTVSASPIRYNTVVDISVPTKGSGSGQSQSLDLNRDGTYEFEMSMFFLGETSPWGIAEIRNGKYSAVVAKPDPDEDFSTAVAFAYGDMIGPAAQPWSKAGSGVLLRYKPTGHGDYHGDWPNNINQTRYEGVRFQIGGETHYGWIAASTDLVLPTYELRVSGWGYETTPDTAIRAGEGELVPEPSSLALFASGAAGIAAVLRRRRARG